VKRLFLLLVVALLSGPALAQDGDLPAERFRPSLDRDGIADVESGAVSPHLVYDLALWFSWAGNPVRGNAAGQEVNLVGNRLGASLVAAVGLYEIFELGLELPFILEQSRDLQGVTQLGDAELGSRLTSFGLGDFRLVPKVQILDRETQLVDLALIAAVTVPSGFPENQFAGEPTTGGLGGYTLSPELALGGRVGESLRYGLNFGYRIRGEHRLASLLVGPEVFYGAGLAVRLHDVAELPLEVTTTATGHVGTTARAPAGVEGTLGLAYDAGDRVQLIAGLGAGLLKDVRVPDARVFIGVRYAPRVFDKDADGVVDREDQCPETPEDLDRFEDQDGCPDPDNDGDGVLDLDDRCPSVSEDRDGFEDLDGCPEADNDDDDILDRDDDCPLQPEDRDGFEDTDGCPDAYDPVPVYNTAADFGAVAKAVEAAPTDAEKRAVWDAFQRKHAGLYEGFILKDVPAEERERRITAFLAALPELLPKTRALFAQMDAAISEHHRRFLQTLPGGLPPFEVHVAPSLLSFNARVGMLDGRLVFVLGPDRMAQLDDDLGVLFAHELFHLYHLGRSPSLQDPPMTMATPLFLEGLATHVSAVLNPGREHKAMMDAALTARCEDPAYVKDLAARFPAETELSEKTENARELYREWFSARGAPEPKRPGYCLGWQIVRRLAATVELSEMSGWSKAEVHARVSAALKDLANQ
jgi:hypothetical protein